MKLHLFFHSCSFFNPLLPPPPTPLLFIHITVSKEGVPVVSKYTEILNTEANGKKITPL